jgi:23S rRNA pseudouridine2605 synthase
MFETLGYQVTKLLRVRIGGLWLGDLEPGRWAILNRMEIAMLLGTATPQAPPRQTTRPRKESPD